MRQRVMIAIALSCNPRLLIADEATTALDVTIQAQIIDLVKRLTRERGTSVIWISHDLGVVAGLCDTVNVMYAGNVVESGPIRELFHRPSHGYTLGLMGSTPRVDGVAVRRLTPIEGVPPNLIEPIKLCPFLPRCRVSVPACQATPPERRDLGGGHWASMPRRILPPRASGADEHAPRDRGPRSPLRPAGRRGHGEGGRRRHVLRREGTDARPRGRVGLRQVDDRLRHPATRARHVGPRPVRRHRSLPGQQARPASSAAQDADHLPGRARLAQSAHADRRPDRRGARHPRPVSRQGPRRPHPRTAGYGRPLGPFLRTLSARAERRPGAAGGHLSRARRRARADHLRRTGLGARRVDPGADRQPAAGPAGAAGPHLHLHLARSLASCGTSAIAWR